MRSRRTSDTLWKYLSYAIFWILGIIRFVLKSFRVLDTDIDLMPRSRPQDKFHDGRCRAQSISCPSYSEQTPGCMPRSRPQDKSHDGRCREQMHHSLKLPDHSSGGVPRACVSACVCLPVLRLPIRPNNLILCIFN